MKRKPRDTSEIVVPKGYELTNLIDTDDNGYGFEDEAIYTEEVIFPNERREKLIRTVSMNERRMF